MPILNSFNNGLNRLGSLFGDEPIPQGGVMGEPQVHQMYNPKLAMAAQLLAGSNSGSGFGEIMAKALMAGQQARQMAAQQMSQQKQMQMDEQLKQAQIQHLQQPEDPSSVREYQYAVKNGYKGSFQDWTTISGQTSRPSSVQEWEFFNQLPKDQQKLYLEMKRNPNMSVQAVGGVPTVVAPSNLGTTTQALSSLPQEVSAGKQLAAGKAAGAVVGETQGAIEKKGINAGPVLKKLDLVEPLIQAATGSLAGNARDKLAAVFGEAPKGAQAIAQLKVLQADLMLSMPRMEGPQSDRDTQLYREAAGQIGDPKVPADIKKAAVGTIRRIQEQYNGNEAAPKIRRYNPETGQIE